MLLKSESRKYIRGNRFILLLFSPLLILLIMYIYLYIIPTPQSSLLKFAHIQFLAATQYLGVSPKYYHEVEVQEISGAAGIITIFCWKPKKLSLSEICVNHNQYHSEFTTSVVGEVWETLPI